MTRHSLNRTLLRVYLLLALVLLVAILARFASYVPGLPSWVPGTGTALYDFIKDMSLLIATGGVAYLTNVFQKRSKFVESLEEEWRGIVRTKAALFTFCEKPGATADDYLAAFCSISSTIDNMRIVYRNAGETKHQIGLYPYAPLHDMRRALQSIDPRKTPSVPAEQRKLVREAILQSFYALRENFLEELDLEEPRHPLLISGGRRMKSPGAAKHARSLQDSQTAHQHKYAATNPEIDDLLQALYQAEVSQTKTSTVPAAFPS